MTTGSRTEGLRGIGSNGFIRTVANLTVTGDLVVLGENRALAGTGSFFWEDADANAEYWAFELPAGASQHVPVVGVGIGLDGVDLGLFDGITQPTMAVMDADRDSFIALDFQADDVARLRTNAATLRFELGGTDEIIYTAGDVAFQQATTISTSTGNLTLAASGALDFDSNAIINGAAAAFTQVTATSGFRPGADSANNEINSSSSGSSSTTMYIGNETIDTTASDVRLKTGWSAPTDLASRDLHLLYESLEEYDYIPTQGGQRFVGYGAQHLYADSPDLAKYVMPRTDDSSWSVQYKYMVPNLIWGWGDHESRMRRLEAQVQALGGTLEV